ncbi:MAG: hypothetical protein GKR95_00325 [Gammaproteobacteria bacterium]|nr:hypothetical protein [Gammaproteobacteria bacterium]
MNRYMMSYLGGDQPATPEEGKAHFEKYRNWLSSLGEAVLVPAAPLKNPTTVNPDGSVTEGSTTSMSGYTIVQANTMEEVLEMGKACPFLEIGGSLEIAELMKMPI